MKKIFSILLIFAFLFSTVGITVAKSYCKMKRAEIEKNQCCKKKCKAKCCGKIIKVFKLSVDSLPSFSKAIKNFSANLISSFAQAFVSAIAAENKPSFRCKPPPLIFSFEPCFIEVFRI